VSEANPIRGGSEQPGAQKSVSEANPISGGSGQPGAQKSVSEANAISEGGGQTVASSESEALQARGCRVLDVFGGSGALGFEALSRGASFALIADKSSEAVGVLRSNAKALGLSSQEVKVLKGDALTVGFWRAVKAAVGARADGFNPSGLDPAYAGKGSGWSGAYAGRDDLHPFPVYTGSNAAGVELISVSEASSFSGGSGQPGAVGVSEANSISFDLVFIDPPYAFADAQVEFVLQQLLKNELLELNAMVIIESANTRTLRIPELQQTDEKKYGSTVVQFLTYEPSS
jgi:16S rRNA G966 N2-methylase RsmD